MKRDLDQKLILPQNDVSIYVRLEIFTVVKFKTWSIVLRHRSVLLVVKLVSVKPSASIFTYTLISR